MAGAAELRAALARARSDATVAGRAAWVAAGAAAALRDAVRLRQAVSRYGAWADAVRAELAKAPERADPWVGRLQTGRGGRMCAGDPLTGKAVCWTGEGSDRLVLARGRIVGRSLEDGEVVDGDARDLADLAFWVKARFA